MESSSDLNGKVALVTGATRGIGWASADILARRGATVLINGATNRDLIQQRVEEIKSAYGTDSMGFAFDVGDPTGVRDCYSNIFKHYKRLDILVNNAGILEDNLLGMISPANIEKTFHINVQGVILNMQYASRLMMRYRSGSIINMASIIGRYGNIGQVVYGASKAAVIGVTVSAAKELAASGIRVNAIAPGFIDTDMTRQLSPEKFEERLGNIKMGRIGTPRDVANAVYFFASNLSSYITGQVLGVDGGMLI